MEGLARRAEVLQQLLQFALNVPLVGRKAIPAVKDAAEGQQEQ